MQQDALAMQQLPPLMQQSELCGVTFDVALAVLISAATATIMKYFMCILLLELRWLRPQKCGPGATNESWIAAAARAAVQRAPRATD